MYFHGGLYTVVIFNNKLYVASLNIAMSKVYFNFNVQIKIRCRLFTYIKRQ